MSLSGDRLAEDGGGTAKRFHLGTHRVRTPEETWDRLRDLLPLAGITRVADVTRLDVIGIPVYQAVRPASRNLSVSQGKGASPAAARVSAAMEALELWHAEDLSRLPRVVLSPREMRSANPVPLETLRWSAEGRALAAMPIPWVRALSLTAGQDGWLPRRMLELDFDESPDRTPRLFHLTSNGLASGNCREEALLHAVCELIERHALYLARQEPGRKVAIVQDSIESPACREIVETLRAAGMRLAVYDLTWEAGVPVLLADFAARDMPYVWRGMGCHPSAEVALSRALTEAAQSRLTYISGARDDIATGGEPQSYRAFDEFAQPPGERRFGDLPDLATASVAADLDAVVERLVRLGLAPFAVDHTRPEIGMAVWTAFVPGLKELAH